MSQRNRFLATLEMTVIQSFLNAYGSGLRQWMTKFHGVATRYLASYLE